MIDKNVVKKLVEEWLQDKEYFLVSIEISPDDRIVVEIDHADGVWIEDCVALSKYIEDQKAAVYQFHWQGGRGA